MTTPATIRLSSAADLITSLPYQLGFHPQRSIVTVSLQGTRLGLVQRFDIPSDSDISDATDALTPIMARENPSTVVLLGYEDVEGESLPSLFALKAAVEEFAKVPDVYVIRDGRWYSATCANQRCCPAEGTPLVEATPIAAEFIGLGLNPSPTREDAVARLEPRADAVQSTSPEGLNVDAAIAAWAKILTVGNLTLAEAADAAGALGNVDFRDGLIGHICPGALPPELIAPEMREIFADMPEIVDEGGYDRLVDLCCSLRDDSAAPALTILANYAWYRGDGGLTRMALKRALRCNPDYRLAQLLERMVDLGIRTPTEA